jgi:nucleoside-diphosphate-sugar epimerase
MKNTLNVVLGGTKNVGYYVVEELRRRNLPVRIVARNPIDDKDFMKGDMANEADMIKVMSGASVIYVCSSFPYQTKVWRKAWPTFIERIIRIASKENAKIVYLDNTYLYGPWPLQNPIHEDHPSSPSSDKGKIRKAVTLKLIEAAQQKKIKLIIGRSANFVSPAFKVGLLYTSFLEKMLIGKNPDYLGNPKMAQTFSYVPDVARALVILGESSKTNGEVFHLPVLDPMTPNQIIDIMNQELNTCFHIKPLNTKMQRLLGLFSPILKELLETRYQTDYPYILSDSKFLSTFNHFKKTNTLDAYSQFVTSFIAKK